ncbi:DeoR/GlpR family DNA-binding transcription regulator [Actinobacillus pleuropneumoniae]|uniref:DeoR/GlpR family DNA-binding transcription regulator n=1 Tax=Actinobacillus pleuropneumoniae TaxID=715 RepID=A0A9Q4DJF7_ACTPL|nr:DeoR/GlpR family DNA-binding transcription regulator [Actinobacillus pleuropneumoniae]MCL7721192.1 DeoR/GlpR family DNA-binding transcription regulator [Actinobacillus pleuropneumoniae]MCL7727116.1 DeoR/GlpR family DNA-binding transcription regulator [Actinobacillus pleuropneumoniae]MCL7730223.1 DeoR/GlpR family DNA-binding transcription regulator [Actinobacillus pleuropneumoniae]MCY6368616.1 DeoR/GlpR family DNA-binding transcription regulator [Actinobacillus pleuropneumoniae]MCY6385487.1 
MESRCSLIIKYLEEFKQASVLELAEQFGVSVETIRRDLNKLAKDGLLHRTHGGAVSNKQRDVGRSFIVRQRMNSNAKKKITENVVKHLFPEATIALDASSTAWNVAQRIPNIPCKVVSSSMRIIYSLSHKPHIETIATGGVYVEKYNAFYGPLSEQLLSRLKIDIAIISCTGVADGAIWESNEVNIAFKRKLLANSKQVFLLVDHSKLERKDRFKMADLSEVDKLFVNQLPPKTLQNYCAQNSIEIVL